MTAELTIGASTVGEASAHNAHNADGHDMTSAQGAAQDRAMIDSIAAFPAGTEGRGNQPLAAELLADGTKRFELTAAIVDWEVRPGQDRQGVGLQRHGSGTADQPCGR